MQLRFSLKKKIARGEGKKINKIQKSSRELNYTLWFFYMTIHGRFLIRNIFSPIFQGSLSVQNAITGMGKWEIIAGFIPVQWLVTCLLQILWFYDTFCEPLLQIAHLIEFCCSRLECFALWVFVGSISDCSRIINSHAISPCHT